jgi:flavin reductase (DIM6/NTAB) family NADH-FMN oxidoreductase RutF
MMSEVLIEGGNQGRALRQALGRFATGVTVITPRTQAGQRLGLTANSFSALSLEPPLVLWSLIGASGSLEAFMTAGHFAINVLAAGQLDISEHFAAYRGDRFAAYRFDEGLDGLPVLPGALASFECDTERTVETGDHILFIGRVRRIRWCDADPLVFSGGRYCSTLTLTKASPDTRPAANTLWAGLG